jgi:hypothetical protein
MQNSGQTNRTARFFKKPKREQEAEVAAEAARIDGKSQSPGHRVVDPLITSVWPPLDENGKPTWPLDKNGKRLPYRKAQPG